MRCRAECGGMNGCSSPAVLQHSLTRAKEGSRLRPSFSLMRSPTQQTALGPSRWREHAAHDLYPAQHGRSLRLVPALASSRSDIYIPPSMGGRTGWSRRLHRLASRIYIPPSMGGRTGPGWSQHLQRPERLQKKAKVVPLRIELCGPVRASFTSSHRVMCASKGAVRVRMRLGASQAILRSRCR